MKYIPLTLGRLNPHPRWIEDEQNPYVALPTDLALLSHHAFLSAISASSAKKTVLRTYFHCGAAWFLIVDW